MNFIQFEKENSPFLQKLKHIDNRSIIIQIEKEDLTILVPTSKSLESVKEIDSIFIQTHVLYINPENPHEFVSLNGLRGTFANRFDSINVHSPPLSESEKDDFLKNPLSTFSKKLNSPVQYSSVILRVSEITLESKSTKMMLISEPLIYQNCHWKTTKTKIEISNSSLVSTRINELIKSHNISNPNNSLFFEHKSNNVGKKKYSYQDFLEKMKHKSTLNLVKSIKKFNDTILNNEYKEGETQKVIRNFFDEMERTINSHSLWKDTSEIEIENTIEGLEKYVTSKLHSKIFSPTIEDLREDNNLASILTKFHVLKPHHLEINENLISNELWNKSLDEFKRINNFKTPRDKMNCISNCCECIFQLIEENKITASADIFLPILIYLILQSNVSHLHSNIKYILDYRNPDKLVSEAGYFLTNIQGAIMFWKNITYENLNISKEEFIEIKNGNLFNTDDFDIILDSDKKLKKKTFDNDIVKINKSESSSEEDNTHFPMTPFSSFIAENEIQKEMQEIIVEENIQKEEVKMDEIIKSNKVELIDKPEHEMNELEKEDDKLDKIEHLVSKFKEN
eukprot:gene914-9823_t